MNELRVFVLPELVTADELAGRSVVVIDVLRATTTIIAALAAGAQAVVPCLTIEDARDAWSGLPAGQAVLAGERCGLPIGGFDLGNAPGDFTPERVGGKVVVLTTTNGTKALLHARRSAKIVVGAFANAAAACSFLEGDPTIDIVCAGTDGRPTDEDTLAAGAMVDRILRFGDRKLNDDAARARQDWLNLAPGDRDHADRLLAAMRASQGGQNLLRIGMDRDVAWAAQIDRFAIVPRFDPKAGRITVAEPG